MSPSMKLTDEQIDNWAGGRPVNPTTDQGIRMAMEIRELRKRIADLEQQLENVNASLAHALRERLRLEGETETDAMSPVNEACARGGRDPRAPLHRLRRRAHETICEHPLMSYATKECTAKARFVARFSDGRTMRVCGRHGNSLAVQTGDRRPIGFEDINMTRAARAMEEG